MARLLVAADIHGAPGALDGLARAARDLRPDAIVIAGDFTHWGRPTGYAGEMVRRLVEAGAGAPVLAIAGNHDPPGTIEEVEAAGGRSIERRMVEAAGERFVGLGSRLGEGFAGRFASSLGPGAELAAEVAPLLEPGRTIFVPHHPPRGACDRAWFGLRGGSRALRALVRERRPKVVLCGHIHEARGIAREDGVLVVNPGPAFRGFYARIETAPGAPPEATLCAFDVT